MPKMKTHRGAAKRVKKTGSGKLKRFKAFKSHILTKKSSKRKRRYYGISKRHEESKNTITISIGINSI